MIPDHIKEEIRSAADIVDVVSDHVKLKRSGSNFMGLCPFHNEKSPSFNVNPALGIFKCFGCGEAGDVFAFLMKIDGVSFVESMRSLAERYHITIPEVQDEPATAEQQLREGIYHALRFAGLFYYKHLIETDNAAAAREYLKKRGFTNETIKKYGVGYAPDSNDALIKAALNNKISEEYLWEAGLIKQDGNGTRSWDAFRNRLMFPIFNPSGKVIGFGARILAGQDGKTQKNAPKYLNSPQTKVYNKSEVLYGIHAAKNEIRKTKEALLVEGYTDVLTLHQGNVLNSVATSGTALTAAQLQLIHRYAESLLMIYDADAAGQNAMDRTLDLALKEGLQVRILHLPEGEDPDSFVRQFGGDALRNYITEEAQDFLTFLVNKAKEANQWDDPNKMRNVVSRILRSIACIPDVVTRETFIQHLNKLSKIGDKALFGELGVIISKIKDDARREADRQPTPSRTEPFQTDTDKESQPAGFYELPGKRPGYEKELIRLMLLHGHPMVDYIGSKCNTDHFEDADLKMMFNDLIQRFTNSEPISPEIYLALDPPFPQITGELIMEKDTPGEGITRKTGKKFSRDGNPFKTVKGELRPLKLAYLEKKKIDLRDKLTKVTNDTEKKQVSDMLMEVSRLRVRYENEALDTLFPDSE